MPPLVRQATKVLPEILEIKARQAAKALLALQALQAILKEETMEVASGRYAE